MTGRSLSGLLMASVMASGACARQAPTPPSPPGTTLTISVRPVRGGNPEVTAVEFREEIRGPLSTTRPFSLASPIVYAGRTGIADRVDAVVVRDASGDVPVTVENDPVNRGGFPYYRHWRATRPVMTPVVVTYRMKSFTGAATVGPQFDFYSHGGGISAGGMALFVLPESLGVVTSRVHWDLSDLARGSTAASTYGDGDFERHDRPEQLMQAYYMAGPLGHYSPTNSSTGFHAYWLGQPAFEPRREMSWTYQSYQNLRKFWGDTSVTAYRVFVRALPGTGGGTALQTSFMVGTAPGNADSTVQGPRGTLTHEMDHMFVGGITGTSGGLGGGTWFAEGLNVYYTRLLLLRSGLTPVDDYLRDVNSNARAYYSNPFHNASADSLARVGFSAGIGNASAQNVPYTRGSLFWSDIDAKIRVVSEGRRKLDDVILPLVAARRRGQPLTQAALVDALVKEVGLSAKDEFEAVIIRGETISPVPGAFGPCFERRSVKYPSPAGGEADGYEWVRIASVPDAKCREW